MPEDFQKYLDEIILDQNSYPITKFEMYSAEEMHKIVHFPFEKGSPIRLRTLPKEDYNRIPLLNQIKYLARLITASGEIKLTKLGFLPTKLVAEIYAQGFIKDRWVELRTAKQLREADVPSVTLVRLLMTISGLAKKRSNKLSLTKMGYEIIENDAQLLPLIIKTYGAKYNWAYLDRYREKNIGQLGFGFSLILLSKYGHQLQPDSFYARKYFMAFPALLDIQEPIYTNKVEYGEHCYSFRFLESFLVYFGLARLDWENRYLPRKLNISKTDLLDKLIEIDEPRRRKEID